MLTLTAILVIVLSSLSLILLLGNESGNRWLLDNAQNYIPGNLTYEHLEGHILKHISIEEIHYINDSFRLDIKHLAFSWQLEQLFNGLFSIEKIQLNGIEFIQSRASPTKDSSTDKPLAPSLLIEGIQLPIAIDIKRFQASDIHLQMADSTQAIQIQQLTLAAHSNESLINISHLLFENTELEFNSHGSLQVKDNFPLQFSTELKLKQADLAKIKVHGEIKGDLQNLQIKQTLEGQSNGTINATIAQPLSDQLSWKSSIKLYNIPYYLIDSSQIKNKTLFNINIKAQGDLKQASIAHARLDIDDGSIKLQGLLNWQSGVLWDIQLQSQHIDPSSLYQQYPGDISFSLNTKGKQTYQQNKAFFELHLALKNLQGNLLNQPIAGAGLISLSNDSVQIKQLQLSSGDAKLNISGKLEQQFDLNWQLKIPHLQHLLPEFKGDISAQGQLSGSRKAPVLEGKINSNSIFYEDNQLTYGKVDFSLSNNKNYNNKLSLTIDKLSVANQLIKKLQLTINGPIEQHLIHLKAHYQQHSLQLNLAGGYNEQKKQWLGNIKQSVINGKQSGLWQQKNPALLSINQKNILLKPFCLYSSTATLCTNAQWQKDKMLANIKLEDFSLSRIKPWLSKDINSLSGKVNIDIELHKVKQLMAKLNINLTPGDIYYQTKKNKVIHLKHNNTHIIADYGAQKLTAKLNIAMGNHGLQGNISIPRTALDKQAETAPIKGHVKLSIKELGLIKAFVPEIDAYQGLILADLDVTGQLNKPNINGKLNFTSEAVSIPLTGLKFSQLRFIVNASNSKQITLDGQIYSGTNKIMLKGNILLNADKNWPATITLKGDNFQIIHQPDLQATISPMLELTHDLNGIKIAGIITIPKAYIHLKELPENSKTVSDDIIIINQAEKKKTINSTIKLSVKLGEQVRIKGFGLNTYISGQIHINQASGQLPTANGELSTKEGTFRAYGQNLTINQGRIFYAGGYLDNPGLNIKASKKVNDITVGIMANGSANDLQFETYADDPQLSSKDITALLLTGQKFDNSQNATLYAGKELTEELSVGVNIGTGDSGSEAVVRYKLGKNLHIEGLSSSEKSSGNVIYSIEIE